MVVCMGLELNDYFSSFSQVYLAHSMANLNFVSYAFTIILILFSVIYIYIYGDDEDKLNKYTSCFPYIYFCAYP